MDDNTKKLIKSLVTECMCDLQKNSTDKGNEKQEIEEQVRAIPFYSPTPEYVADILTDDAIQTLIKNHIEQLKDVLGENYLNLYSMISHDKLNAALYEAILKQLERNWDTIYNN